MKLLDSVDASLLIITKVIQHIDIRWEKDIFLTGFKITFQGCTYVSTQEFKWMSERDRENREKWNVCVLQ